MDEVEVVVAHKERATLRVGDVFLKVDGDAARLEREVQVMDLVPVRTPEVLWRKPSVLALAALPGSALGRLGPQSAAPRAAWVAAGAVVRELHDTPPPPWAGRDLGGLRAALGPECDWFIDHDVLPADVVRRNRELAESALDPRPAVFTHGDLQVDHIFVDGDEVTGVLDWSEGAPGDALADLATLTLGHPDRLDDVLAGYGADVDRDGIRAWWALRCLLNVRWLTEHGFDPAAPGCEIEVLRTRCA